MERRLAAILAADAAGCSRLIRPDHAAAHAGIAMSYNQGIPIVVVSSVFV